MTFVILTDGHTMVFIIVNWFILIVCLGCFGVNYILLHQSFVLCRVCGRRDWFRLFLLNVT